MGKNLKMSGIDVYLTHDGLIFIVLDGPKFIYSGYKESKSGIILDIGATERLDILLPDKLLEKIKMVRTNALCGIK